MRNPFEKVYCEDCKSIILSNIAKPDWPTRFAECKKKVFHRNAFIGKKTKPEYYGCTMRMFSFCFKFRKKED